MNVTDLNMLTYFFLMGVLTLFMTFKEKNYIMFAVQKDQAGVVSGNQS